VLDFFDGLQADGLLCSVLMLEEVVHVGLHVGEVAEYLRSRDDAGNGDPLMAFDIAIHTGEIEERCAETSDEQDEDKAERKRKFLADGEAGNPADGRATHGQRYHSTVGTARGSVATDGLAHDRFVALVPVLVEGDVRVDDVDRVLPCDGEECACRSDPSVVELSLNCGFDSHNREAVPLSSIDRMAVRAPGEAVQGAALDVVAESLLVVQDVPHDQSCVDHVGRIGSCEWGQQQS